MNEQDKQRHIDNDYKTPETIPELPSTLEEATVDPETLQRYVERNVE